MSGRYLRQSSICAASWRSSSTDHGWYPTVWIRIFGFWQIDTRLLSDKDVNTWCPQMRVCNFNSSGTLYSGFLGDISSDCAFSDNDFLGAVSSDTNFLESNTSCCKLAVLIQVRCTNGSSFVYNINPLSCHGIALIYTIAWIGDFDKLAILLNSVIFCYTLILISISERT